MKQWVIIGLALIGGYAVFKYVTAVRSSPVSGGAQTPTGVSGFLSSINDGQLLPGVPAYNGIPSLNKPDQIAAALPNNAMATVPSNGIYEPAFGANQNQVQSSEVMSW